jgi:hypothetical protein
MNLLLLYKFGYLPNRLATFVLSFRNYNPYLLVYSCFKRCCKGNDLNEKEQWEVKNVGDKLWVMSYELWVMGGGL